MTDAEAIEKAQKELSIASYNAETSMYAGIRSINQNKVAWLVRVLRLARKALWYQEEQEKRKQQVSRKKPTMCDKIRAMSDDELTDAIYKLIYATEDLALWFCKGKKECGDLMDDDKEIPEEMCRKCLLEKLRQPVEDPAPDTMAEYEKQHSGLLEED